jgi:hypothetical protein
MRTCLLTALKLTIPTILLALFLSGCGGSGTSGTIVSPPVGGAPRFTKPLAGTPINSASPFAAGLVLAAPFNEGVGASILDLISGQAGTAGPIPFTWVTESAEFTGPAVNFTGATSVSIPASSPFFKSPPANGYSFAILFKPLDISGNSLTIALDTDTIAATALYGQGAGRLFVVRDSNNVVSHIKFTIPAAWVYLVVTVDQDRATVWANLSNGAPISGMQIQGSAACDLAKTWGSGAALPSVFYFAGSNGGAYSPSWLIAGEWIWRDRVLTAAEINTLYANPFVMY